MKSLLYHIVSLHLNGDAESPETASRSALTLSSIRKNNRRDRKKTFPVMKRFH